MTKSLRERDKPPMDIMVTGSRDWDDPESIQWILQRIAKRFTSTDRALPLLVHGAARGADSMAASIWISLGGSTLAYPVTPAEWSRYGSSAGFMRNDRMVASMKPGDLCLAFSRANSSGTAHALKAAAERGLRMWVIRKD